MSIGRSIYGICSRNTYSEIDIPLCYLITKPKFLLCNFFLVHEIAGRCMLQSLEGHQDDR